MVVSPAKARARRAKAKVMTLTTTKIARMVVTLMEDLLERRRIKERRKVKMATLRKRRRRKTSRLRRKERERKWMREMRREEGRSLNPGVSQGSLLSLEARKGEALVAATAVPPVRAEADLDPSLALVTKDTTTELAQLLHSDTLLYDS